MTGGMLQLAFNGAQDVYLTANPEITLFKIVYKKYTLFSIENKDIKIEGKDKFDNILNCRILKYGDLINKFYLKMTITGVSDKSYKWAFIENLGYHIIDFYELSIGNLIVDKHYSDWLSIWHKLNNNFFKNESLNKMIGNLNNFTNLSKDDKKIDIIVPIILYFNKNVDLSFPIFSIEEEIEMKFKFKSQYLCVNKENGLNNLNLEITNLELSVNYIYLDNNERNNFINKSHEYLIDQIQHNNPDLIDYQILNHSIDLDYKNPCKSLFFVPKITKYYEGNTFFGTDIITATKRFILAYCYKNDNNFLDNEGGIILTVGSNLIPKSNVSNLISNIISNSKVRKKFHSSSNGSISDITLSLDYLLTSEQISLTINEFRNKYCNLVTRNTTGEGSINHDLVLYQWDNYMMNIDKTEYLLNDINLEINGFNRYISHSYKYYNLILNKENNFNIIDGIYLISFSLKLKDHQPSGTLNFSKINKSRLNIEINENIDSNINLYIFGLNYNLIKIENKKVYLNY